MLHVVHPVKGLHGCDDLRTRHLLVEGVDKAVGARTILKANSERVEVRLQAVGLSAERQTPRHAELITQGEKDNIDKLLDDTAMFPNFTESKHINRCLDL